ncbi:hypothetical protein MDAP_000591 [Mitosporidium daphniae]|uniref:Phosphatidylglycerol/phosphatidylinositol transfer protein n=1 Tax=Mitosporidium daphniae TaxID=1485682 RepID=A0A098VQK5_9MICR|nr:phosphatidylglycerol/phosphatidylinositol transfer protein [Mitosporidium daphniae]KGG50001.1 phosphatidylglycerol/phosphatidylinositol transfer protein [Mitosporidium daphniae]|eukprot:XP_013236437.1 phosphatidylglycerol/phosphatidylinositol transfer protein [Mitosporidium daphniae]
MKTTSIAIVFVLFFASEALAHLGSKHHSIWRKDPSVLFPLSWQSCGVESDSFQLNALSISPDPPIRGQKFTLSIKGHLSNAIGPEDVAKVVVKYGGFTLVSALFNICENLGKLNPSEFKCPISAGPFDISHSEVLPIEVPPGKYNIHVEAFSSSQFSGIFCLDLDLKIGSIKGPSSCRSPHHQLPKISLDQLVTLRDALIDAAYEIDAKN